MSEYVRYAIYYLPPEGALSEFGAAWLGWSVDAGRAVPQPGVDGIEALTRTPRKYGFHATLKPPFRLAPGTTPDGLAQAAARLAAGLAPVTLAALVPGTLGHFLALVPAAPSAALDALAARCVADLDCFRAAPTQAELNRRRAAGLTAAQEANLQRWGYPHVMDGFRFHMTLTGRQDADGLARAARALAALYPVRV